jgi:hypothetical protein
MLLVSYLRKLGLRAVSKVDTLLWDVSEPTDMTYDLDRAYCYYCTSILGAFLRILSHQKLTDRVLVMCLCYSPLNCVDFISGEKSQNYVFSEPTHKINALHQSLFIHANVPYWLIEVRICEWMVFHDMVLKILFPYSR